MSDGGEIVPQDREGVGIVSDGGEVVRQDREGGGIVSDGGEGGVHLEGVVEDEDDLVVVIVDGHLQVQAVELAQVSARRWVALQGSRSMTSSTAAGIRLHLARVLTSRKKRRKHRNTKTETKKKKKKKKKDEKKKHGTKPETKRGANTQHKKTRQKTKYSS